MKKYEITKKGELVAGPVEAVDIIHAEAKARLMGIDGVITVSEIKTEAHTPSDIVMENIAVYDCLIYNEFSSTVVDRIERAVNAYDEDQRKIAVLLEAVKACKRIIPGVFSTDQVTGETFDALIDKAISQAEARP